MLDSGRPPIPLQCPDSLARLLKLCWEENVNERPTFEVIVTFLKDTVRSLETEVLVPGVFPLRKF
jgi:hypothetical protein